MATQRRTPLSPREIDHFRRLLEDRRRIRVVTIERYLREAKEEALEDETEVPRIGPAKEAERAEYAELSRINEALRRIIDGTFGACEDCGRPIAADRLELLPTTTRCVECQERIEAA
jgi:DnaK suppressor protein